MHGYPGRRLNTQGAHDDQDEKHYSKDSKHRHRRHGAQSAAEPQAEDLELKFSRLKPGSDKAVQQPALDVSGNKRTEPEPVRADPGHGQRHCRSRRRRSTLQPLMWESHIDQGRSGASPAFARGTGTSRIADRRPEALRARRGPEIWRGSAPRNVLVGIGVGYSHGWEWVKRNFLQPVERRTCHRQVSQMTKQKNWKCSACGVEVPDLPMPVAATSFPTSIAAP